MWSAGIAASRLDRDLDYSLELIIRVPLYFCYPATTLTSGLCTAVVLPDEVRRPAGSPASRPADRQRSSRSAGQQPVVVIRCEIFGRSCPASSRACIHVSRSGSYPCSRSLMLLLSLATLRCSRETPSTIKSVWAPVARPTKMPTPCERSTRETEQRLVWLYGTDESREWEDDVRSICSGVLDATLTRNEQDGQDCRPMC